MSEVNENSLVDHQTDAKNVDTSEITYKDYYDDNKKLYRKGKKLIPNNTYTINGHQYTTNHIGAIVSAKAESLRLKTHKRRRKIKDSLDDIGKGFQKSSDNRGHLIADQFGGANGLENIIPQNANVNGGDFKDLEDELADFVKAGKKVTYELQLNYFDKESYRPDEITVKYTVDDIESEKTFDNP